MYMDDDDIKSHHLTANEFAVKKIIGPAISMGQCNTECLKIAKGSIIILANDDMIIRTNGWDVRLMELHHMLDHQIYLAYPNDLIKKNKLCSFPILSRKLCELLAEPYPKEYSGGFIDWHLQDIFVRLKKNGHNLIFYLDDIIFEHLHFRVGKASMDDTYKKRARYSGDAEFVGLAEMRRQAALCLMRSLNGGDNVNLETTPVRRPREFAQPSSVFKALALYSRVFLGDRTLPFGWRFHLWLRTFARYLAGRGLLWPFYQAFLLLTIT
jgi:hypothetical protein